MTSHHQFVVSCATKKKQVNHYRTEEEEEEELVINLYLTLMRIFLFNWLGEGKLERLAPIGDDNNMSK